VIDLGRSCTRFRPLLVDFVDRGEVSAETGAALAHLDRCGRCTEAIESTMLTITALRRLGDDAATLEPSADAWPRLRVRISRWRRRPAIMSPVAGMAMSVAMVALLAMPFRFAGGAPLESPVTVRISVDQSTSLEERAAESAFLARQRLASKLPADDSPASSITGTHRVNYPDNYRPERKEVDPVESTNRSAQPI